MNTISFHKLMSYRISYYSPFVKQKGAVATAPQRVDKPVYTLADVEKLGWI